MRALAAFALGLALLASPAGAQQSGVQVSPVIVAASPESGLAAVRLRNWRGAEIAFEARIYTWRQENGRDVLTPAADVVIAPSIFAIAPDAEQIVRIGAAPLAPNEAERAYRLIFREIAPLDADARGLRVQLQLSLPVFVTPAQADASLALRAGGGGAALINEGRVHARLVRFVLAGGDAPGPGYLLAGARLPLPAGAEGVEISYRAGEDDALRRVTLGPDARPMQAPVR
ncbi:MAG: fimbria/pilus periplasmic chaperone [Alphaproteobacteria bacterium]|nr:fimbria/pilus periplasmic chaperone [Alphaproteobacteria bacterium]